MSTRSEYASLLEHLKVNGLRFTNLQKILFPELNIAKYQMIEYYLNTATRILPFLFDRALTVHRFPDGVDRDGFYGKDAPKGKPSWVVSYNTHSKSANRDIEYIVCNNVETLAWLANLAALEINIPLSRTRSIENPDLVLLDIDPEPPAGFIDAIDVALRLKTKLDLLGLRSYAKTSGKKGLHIVVPIVPKYSFRETRVFAREMGRFLAKESKNVVSEFRQSRVPGTVFIDYLQNARLRTMICPYSLRANQDATVSTPLRWSEVKPGLNPHDLNLVTTPKRRENPWKDMFEHRQTLDFDQARKRKKTTLASDQAPESLREYAEKRDFTKTTEPVGGGTHGTSDIFVVQEHQARRLHHDLRLSWEGVLKSWAVPKKVPGNIGVKRLAVQTEDHPLEYSAFEGSIPPGQYGAGTVKIWDKGTYKLKDWTADKIEFFLQGKRLTGTYVLIRFRNNVRKPSNKKEWLLVKTKDQPAASGKGESS